MAFLPLTKYQIWIYNFSLTENIWNFSSIGWAILDIQNIRMNVEKRRRDRAIEPLVRGTRP